MRTDKIDTPRCHLCGASNHNSALTNGALVRPMLFEKIVAEHPDFTRNHFICQKDLARYRAAHIHSLLEDERGEVSKLEHSVLEAIRNHELLSPELNDSQAKSIKLADKLSDRIATFGGSWPFIIAFFSFILIWILVNLISLFAKPFDPYPFILLNLVLSCLASIQAPIIMMSQNRQELKNRKRSETDFKINLKAELEIRQLHEKLDHVLNHQWERLVEIQQAQIEILEELSQKRS